MAVGGVVGARDTRAVRLLSNKLVAAALAATVISLGVTAATAGARSAGTYPPQFEHQFMRGCGATSGGRVALCRCALRWLERRYSYAALISLYRLHPVRYRRVAVRAVLACIR